MYTIKSWKKIKRDIQKTDLKEWKPTIWTCKDGFISEVSFIKKNKCDGGLIGFSYMCDQCTQGLLKKIAKELPQKYVKMV